jgi:hypothetical protein
MQGVQWCHSRCLQVHVFTQMVSIDNDIISGNSN